MATTESQALPQETARDVLVLLRAASVRWRVNASDANTPVERYRCFRLSALAWDACAAGGRLAPVESSGTHDVDLKVLTEPLCNGHLQLIDATVDSTDPAVSQFVALVGAVCRELRSNDIRA